MLVIMNGGLLFNNSKQTLKVLQIELFSLISSTGAKRKKYIQFPEASYNF